MGKKKGGILGSISNALSLDGKKGKKMKRLFITSPSKVTKSRGRKSSSLY